MKKKWTLSLLVIVAAVIATSCGQPKSNKSELSSSSNIDPRAQVIIDQSSQVSVDSLIASNQVFVESNEAVGDQGLIMLGYFNSSAKFVGNIFYGTRSNPYKGEQMTLEFLNYDNSSYTYFSLMSGRGNAHHGFQPTQTSQLNVSFYSVTLHSNPNCLIVENQVSNYEAVVCKQ